MKKPQTQLKSISRSLLALADKVDELSDQIESLQGGQGVASRGPASQKGADSRALSVLDTVYEVIRRSRKGASISKLREKTGLDARQVSNALYKLTKRDKIVAIQRGLYAKK
jgi:predicted Rossmann fold nucleotide-binding protein DprA/Smf involved in DNA uptake